MYASRPFHFNINKQPSPVTHCLCIQRVLLFIAEVVVGIFSGLCYCNMGSVDASERLWKSMLIFHAFHKVFHLFVSGWQFYVLWSQNRSNYITNLTKNHRNCAKRDPKSISCHRKRTLVFQN